MTSQPTPLEDNTVLAHAALIDCLRANPVFTQLDDDILETVLADATIRTMLPGEIIVRQGDPASAFGILSGGRAKMIQVTADGRQILLRYIVTGQEFGLIAALPDLAYPLTIEAVEECQVMYWPGATLAAYFGHYPQLALNALRIMVLRNQELQARYRELLTERVDQRLARALLRLAHVAGSSTKDGTSITLSLTREDLAELVGTTLYTVSRTLSQWDQAGLVNAGRERVIITDTSGLEEIAGAAEVLPVSCVAPCALVEMIEAARSSHRSARPT